MAGGRLMHLSKAKLKVVRMGLRFALDGSPVRIVAFHVLNAVPFYHLIMQLMRPWARKELKDLVKQPCINKKPLRFFEFLGFLAAPPLCRYRLGRLLCKTYSKKLLAFRLWRRLGISWSFDEEKLRRAADYGRLLCARRRRNLCAWKRRRRWMKSSSIIRKSSKTLRKAALRFLKAGTIGDELLCTYYILQIRKT